MSRLPPEPVPPSEFFHDAVPALFADLVLGEAERAVELKVGVVLHGAEPTDEGAGTWTLHFVDGELGVQDGRAEDCDVTIVQSERDWRAALWEGRPSLVADLVAEVATGGPEALRAAGPFQGLQNPEALEELAELSGLIEVVIGDDGDDVEDWRIGIQIGPGPIPEAAQASLRLGAEQADALRRGALHPVEALIGGQLRLEGDLGLIIRLQAIAMAASMPRPPSS